MRTIISVTESRSMPGRYTVTCDAKRNKHGLTHPADVFGSSAAAAKAMEYVISVGSSGYVIFAPSSVMAMIPEDMRQRG